MLVPDFWTGPDYDFWNISGSDLDIAKNFRTRTGLSNFNVRTTLITTTDGFKVMSYAVLPLLGYFY